MAMGRVGRIVVFQPFHQLIEFGMHGENNHGGMGSGQLVDFAVRGQHRRMAGFAHHDILAHGGVGGIETAHPGNDFWLQILEFLKVPTVWTAVDHHVAAAQKPIPFCLLQLRHELF